MAMLGQGIGVTTQVQTETEAFLEVNEEVRRAVASEKDSATIKKIAVQHGMRTLRGDGNIKVLQGLTSIDEIMRVTAEGLE